MVRFRRGAAGLGIAVLITAGWAGIAAGPATAAPTGSAPSLPANCQQNAKTFRVTCTWTAGLGQRFTVPPGVTSIQVVAIGARGGGAGPGAPAVPGGAGGLAQSTIDAGSNGPLARYGRTLLIDVGTPGGAGAASGVAGAAGVPGGGSGYSGYSSDPSSGGGGGYSAVRLAGLPAGSEQRLVVAGGGGGSAGDLLGGAGGRRSGSTSSGGDGQGGRARGAVGGGQGATATGPGAGGRRAVDGSCFPGDAGFGATGGTNTGNEVGFGTGGGGGGGWYGGGSGGVGCFDGLAATVVAAGAGGGGSSHGQTTGVSARPALVTIAFDPGPVAIRVTPATATVEVGSVQQYVVHEVDYLGQEIGTTSDVFFGVPQGKVDCSSSDLTCRPLVAGTFAISVTSTEIPGGKATAKLTGYRS